MVQLIVVLCGWVLLQQVPRNNGQSIADSHSDETIMEFGEIMLSSWKEGISCQISLKKLSVTCSSFFSTMLSLFYFHDHIIRLL